MPSEDIEMSEFRRADHKSNFQHQPKKTKMNKTSRICCVGLSSTLALASLVLLTVSLFSAAFRYNLDNAGGTKHYGLFRFCYEPEARTPSRQREDDSNTQMCHLRNYIRSSHCEESSYGHMMTKATRDCFGDFELASIILMSIAMACCLLSVVFAVCTIFTSFGALANNVVLLAAAISSVSALLTYTYFYELKENQSEVIQGYQYLIHFDWGYYLLMSAALLLVVAFVCSIFGSALVLVNKSQKRKSKVQSISL